VVWDRAIFVDAQRLALATMQVKGKIGEGVVISAEIDNKERVIMEKLVQAMLEYFA